MTRLTAALQAAADEPADLDLDAVHTRVDRRRRRRVRARAGACAVGALVVVAGIGLAAGAGDRGADVRVGEPEGPGVEEPTSEPVPSSTEEPTTGSSTTSSTTEPVPSTEEPTTTTSEVPATTEAPPPSTTAPAPSSIQLEWTYVGTEQWRLGQPQCPEITHRLDAEANAADGVSWTMREDYCGEIRGSRWNGAGTWSLTSADGTSLSGTYTSSVEMDGPGEPYTMVVEGGTGRLAGADGTCEVVVNLTPLAFGSQRQDGTIDCDLTVPGSV